MKLLNLDSGLGARARARARARAKQLAQENTFTGNMIGTLII